MRAYVSTAIALLVLVFVLGVVDYGREKFNKREAREILAGNPALVAKLAGHSGHTVALDQLAADERSTLHGFEDGAQRSAYAAFFAKGLLVAGFAWLAMRINRGPHVPVHGP